MVPRLTAYRNEKSGKTFCHFNAESRRDHLNEILSKVHHFLLMDGSTDTGNIDNEIFLVLWCDVDCDDQIVRTHVVPLCFQT